MKESLEYYNKFDDKLLKDYALGNKRIVSAIETLARFVPEQSKDILDIGCGIGWSTFEFSRFYPNSKITGVDLSPVLINKANSLFKNENLNYQVFDITKEFPKNQYDIIVMLDVYEHIPLVDRKKFHSSIDKLLKSNARLIIACPSVYHQDFLRKNNPSGLQPVDEDVDLGILQEFADDVNGSIIYFEFQDIWKPFDYLYVVIQKSELYNSLPSIKSNIDFEVEPKVFRNKRLKKNLDIDFKLLSRESVFSRVKRKIVNFIKDFS